MRLNAFERLKLAIFGRAAVLYIGIGDGQAVCGVDIYQRNSSHQMPLYSLSAEDMTAVEWFASNLRLATGLRIHTDQSAKRQKAKNDGTFPESKFKIKGRGFGWTPRSDFR